MNKQTKAKDPGRDDCVQSLSVSNAATFLSQTQPPRLDVWNSIMENQGWLR